MHSLSKKLTIPQALKLKNFIAYLGELRDDDIVAPDVAYGHGCVLWKYLSTVYKDYHTISVYTDSFATYDKDGFRNEIKLPPTLAKISDLTATYYNLLPNSVTKEEMRKFFIKINKPHLAMLFQSTY